LYLRGYYGYDWSSSEGSSYDVRYLYFSSSYAYTFYGRWYGFSVRCIAE
jgi:hypothetical protein